MTEKSILDVTNQHSQNDGQNITGTSTTDKALARLDWLRDNNPDFLMESYQDGTLKKHVTDIVTRAMLTAIQLRENGIEEQIITEVIFSMVAPAETLEPGIDGNSGRDVSTDSGRKIDLAPK